MTCFPATYSYITFERKKKEYLSIPADENVDFWFFEGCVEPHHK